MPSLAALAIFASIAVGEPAPTIVWRAPPPCPDAAEVAVMTTSLLQVRAAEHAQLAVYATVAEVAGRFHLSLELRSTHGHDKRVFESDNCRSLARAVALAAAVHLDPLRVAQGLPDPLPAPPPVAVTPPPPPTAVMAPELREDPPPLVYDDAHPPGLYQRTDPSRASQAESDVAGHVRLEGGIGHGLVPGTAGEVALLGGASGPNWRLEGGFASAPRHEVLTPNGALGGRVDRLTAVLRGCAVWRFPPERRTLAILGCIGGEAGAIGATTTRGAPSPGRGWAPWGAVFVGPSGRVRLLGPLGLWVGVEAVIALTHPTITIAGEGLFRVAPLGVRATVGLDVEIPVPKRRPRSARQ